MGLYSYLALGHKDKKAATVYRRCKDMPLYNYMEYLESNDLRWFTKEFVNAPDLVKVMTDFYGEMISLTGDYRIIGKFTRLHKVMKLKGRYDTVSSILFSIYNYDPDKGIEGIDFLLSELEKWDYKISRENDLIEQVNTIHTKLQGLLTQIELIEKEISADDAVEKIEIAEQIINVSLILKLSYRIDPKATNVAEWILLQKQAKKAAEHERERDRPSSIQKGTRRP